MAAQEDGELFDLYAADGSPLGVQKARALVHRDGDWHKSLHIWVILLGGGGEALALFQRRSAGKDTWPRALDVAVAGHYRAGEGLEQGLREADEEIGLQLKPADVVRIGLRRRADTRAASRIRDNEIQDIFMARSDVSLSALVPFEDEVEALIALPMNDAARLFSGAIERATGLTTAPGRPLPEPVEVRLDEFIPAEDGYYAQAMKSILEHMAGRSPAPFTLG
jgi:isopentenyldiphosphate isomerase